MTREGVVRLAETVLRTAGGGAVLLRVPAPPVANDAAEELGLMTPTFNDVVLAPAVFRKAGSETGVVVAAAAVNAAVAAGGSGAVTFAAAEAWLKSAAGVVVDGELYVIGAVVASRAHGETYAWRLTVELPAE